MFEHLAIVAAATVFGIQHSGISALRVKHWIIDRWGKEGYSRIFNVTSFLALIPASLSLNYWDWLYFLQSPELVNPLLFLSGVILLALGVVVAALASRSISVSTVADMRTDRKPALVTGGLYARTRHPLYLATILFLLSLIAFYPFSNILVFSLAFVGYVIIGAHLEERKLVIQYGEQYIAYRKTVGFLLPRLSTHKD
ncbi:MAG: isoprenylcysteine carboxylmethyltransferase family protein [Candidatus Thorarchaeota archaeon]|nr:isoprenylcysteine carboxylmethyltransferase family protein [Candidatus Thorarchaeota archaeon]